MSYQPVSDDAANVIAAAIKNEVAHPLGSMRLLPQSEDDLADAIIVALANAGFEIVKRDRQLAAGQEAKN